MFSSNRSKGSAINWINKQLYIRLSTDTKTNIIKATNHINFKPEAYKTILTNLIQTRPDWILSRQRRWGTPLCLIINAANKTILDEKLKQRLNALFYCHKESQWLRCKTLYNKYSGQNWKKLNNVIDVWFDASSVYALRPHRTKWDLIIEGIDQHRGWFQSMLINAVLTTGAAPVKTIITHGFIMQDPAKKLSKSLPSKLAQTLLKQLVNLNVNIVRTWVCTIKWAENQVMCANWLLKAKTAFLKINNTLKWGLDAARSVLKHNNINQNLNTLTPTDKLILHKLKLHNNRIIIAYANYNLNKVVSIIVVTCDATLSTCFNIIKDQTYCDFSETQNRLNSISVLKCAVSQLVVWLTPIMPSVCYELKTQLKINNSVINKLPNKWFNKRVALNWKIIDNLKKLAASVRLRSGRKMAELCINVYICDVRTLTAFKNINTSLLFGCSKANIIWISHRHKKDIKLSETQSISVWKSKLKRCARCRRLLYFNEY
ncbi:MAG: class I tRNA ligase family protein [Candidatus Hodgkinia cicadicola]